jgi:hypothetical protein
MSKRYYTFAFILVMSLFLLSGCQNTGYSEKQAKSIMMEYIQEKYGDSPDFEWIRWYKKKNYSQGYYALTTEGYYIRMNVFTEEGNDPYYTCLDTREYGDIADALETALAGNPLSEYLHVEVNPIYNDSQERLWDSLGYAFIQKWGGDLEEFLTDSSEMVSWEFFLEPIHTTKFYITIRPDSLADYVDNYKGFKEYISNAMSKYTDIIYNVCVLTPTVPTNALDSLNYDGVVPGVNPTILLDDLNQRKPLVIPSQAEGVEGYAIENLYRDTEVDESSLSIETAESPMEIVKSYDGKSYRIISLLYRVDNASNVDIAMLFDFSVILKEYIKQNPDAQLGRDYVMLEIDNYGEPSQIDLQYSSGAFISPEAARNYLIGDNKYTYIYGYYQDVTQICFAVLEQE